MAYQKTTKLRKGAPLVSLHDLFVVKLCELYDIETTLVKVLPKMAKNADNQDLQMLLEEHMTETEGQVERLEQIFGLLGEKPKAKKSETLRGMVADAESMMKMKGESAVMDAGIIAASQGIEHHEIACYGTAITWSEMMGHDKVTELLRETLNEEKLADEKLTALAESVVNIEANKIGDDTEEDVDSDIADKI